MEIPTNIEYILERIEKSEEEWKALYMAVWHYAGYIDAIYINPKEDGLKGLPLFVDGATATSRALFITPARGSAYTMGTSVHLESGEATIKLELPGARKGFHEWNIKELYSILSSRDGQFTIGHLQTLFSLFEELLDETAKALFNLDRNMGKWVNIEKFFNLNDFNDVLSAQELKELKLAKETRNCFTHSGSKIDKLWLSAYQDARGTPPANLEGKSLHEGVSNMLHETESWHDLIVGASKKIGEKILIA